MTDTSAGSSAPGWDAITRVLRALYGTQEPQHVAYPATGTPGLLGCSAYRADGHWHAISYGLTETHTKESPVADQSGFGFEITMRVPFTASQGSALGVQEVPAWLYRLIGSVGRYVWQGNMLRAGDHLNMQQPLTGPDQEPVSTLTGLLVVPDLELEPVQTVHGSVRFLQLVGLTSGEVAGLESGEPLGPLVTALTDASPLLVTDPQRPSSLTGS